jgi:hypothetical protein
LRHTYKYVHLAEQFLNGGAMKLDETALVYTGTTTQREELIGAVRLIRDSPGMSYRTASDACVDWWQEVGPDASADSFGISVGTLSRMANENHVPAWEKARVLYAFLSFGWDKGPLITVRGLGGVPRNSGERFADSLLRHFNEVEYRPYPSLGGLVGDNWEAYRPSWRTGGDGYIIRSHIEVRRKGNAYWLREHQRFEFRGYPVDEVDEGVLFPFAQSIACLSKDIKNVCMKCYSFTMREPEPGPHTSTEIMSGSVMAISNQGPHWSGPIYLRRVQGPRGALAHVHISTLEKEPSLVDVLDDLRARELKGHLPPKVG